MVRSALLLLFLLPFLGCADPSFKLRDVSDEKPQAEAGAKETPVQLVLATPTPIATPEAVAEATLAPTQAPFPVKPEVFDNDTIKFNISEENWKKISDEDGVQAYQEKNAKGDIVSFRGETIIPAPLQKVAAVLNDFSNRKEWVDGLAEARIIDERNRFDRIEYNHSKVPWPFQDRDFVYNLKIQVNRTPATMLITMRSVEDSREPVHEGIVRGEIVHSYYYMKEAPGAVPSTRLVIEMALDPKGSIPLWLVNATQKKWPHNTMMALKRMALKPEVVVPKDIAEYFAVPPVGDAPKTKKMR